MFNRSQSIRLAAVLGIAALFLASATIRPRADDAAPQSSRASQVWKVGDRLPSSIPVTPEDGYARSYALAIIDGRIVLVVDRENRTIVEVHE